MNQDKYWCLLMVLLVTAVTHGVSNQPMNFKQDAGIAQESKKMELGNFSISLAVKDLQTSREFYEKLDFEKVGGDPKQNWLVLQNGPTTIGLFQGMFEENILTFNPGWDRDKQTLEDFVDVREIQAKLKERGIGFATEAEAEGEGPASFVIVDPDGNSILVDQHVDKPKSP